MIIKQMAVGSMDQFCYLIACEKTLQGALIDPGAEPKKILDNIRQSAVSLKYIINTHYHYDHIWHNYEIWQETNAKIVFHKLDYLMLRSAPIYNHYKEMGLNTSVFEKESDIYLTEDNDVLTIGELQLKILHTPGHSAGGISIYGSGNIFTGDTVFVGACGRTDLPGGNFDQLIHSIKTKISVLPEETILWPGHDYGDSISSTVGREKNENPFFTNY